MLPARTEGCSEKSCDGGEREKRRQNRKKGKSLPVFPRTKNTVHRVCVCLCARTLVCVLGVRGNGVAVWGRQEVRMIVGEWGRGKEKKRQLGNSP